MQIYDIMYILLGNTEDYKITVSALEELFGLFVVP